jgi:hypothetical protein
MSILTACQDAAVLLSVNRPGSLVGNSDTTAQMLLATAHIAGDDIMRRAEWSRMIKQAVVSTGVLPADYQRLISGNAMNVTVPALAPVRGPLSNDQLAGLQRLGTTSALYYALTGGTVAFSRALVGETVVATYVANAWLANGLNRYTRAVSDADTTLFPERLLVRGIIWNWRKEKGQESNDQLATLIAMIEEEVNADRGVTT